jgi:hypothetical protein
MGDLGYFGITGTCPNAMPPQKRPRSAVLSEQQKSDNRRLSRDRILVEKFFSRWKSLFGICGRTYRGDLGLLGHIIRPSSRYPIGIFGKTLSGGPIIRKESRKRAVMAVKSTRPANWTTLAICVSKLKVRYALSDVCGFACSETRSVVRDRFPSRGGEEWGDN